MITDKFGYRHDDILSALRVVRDCDNTFSEKGLEAYELQRLREHIDAIIASASGAIAAAKAIQRGESPGVVIDRARGLGEAAAGGANERRVTA